MNGLTEKTIFLHIPKAAGGTFREILVRNFRRGRVVSAWGNWDTNDPRFQEFLDSLTEEVIERTDAITGHVPFGIHRYFPGEVAYITLLRDPVDYAISLYYYIRETPYVLAVYPDVANMSFESFIADDRFCNIQTRYLRGKGKAFSVPVTADCLSDAMENLKGRIAVVGIVSRFDETVVLCQCRFGWKNLNYSIMNATERRPGLASISENRGLVDKINASNRYDMELYRCACDQMERHIQSIPEFASRLQEFRQSNNNLLLKGHYRMLRSIGPVIRKSRSMIRLAPSYSYRFFQKSLYVKYARLAAQKIKGE